MLKNFRANVLDAVETISANVLNLRGKWKRVTLPGRVRASLVNQWLSEEDCGRVRQ